MCNCPLLKIKDEHGSNTCPIAAAMYCSICQTHGHPTMKCPDRASWHYRKPEFVEQLIPSSILSHYNITSKTKIHGDHEHIPYIHGEPTIEIPFDEDGKNIRATLASHNLPCSSVKENKRVMEAYGELIGKKVVYTEVTEKRVLNKKLLKK